VIPGDGIGIEVVPEGPRVLDAAAAAFDLKLDFNHSSADYDRKHGNMLPDDWFDELVGVDAIFFGAVGWPEVVPDHVSLWDSLLQFRRHFDLSRIAFHDLRHSHATGALNAKGDCSEFGRGAELRTGCDNPDSAANGRCIIGQTAALAGESTTVDRQAIAPRGFQVIICGKPPYRRSTLP
jgi:Isocitrate/isopropylmalate dehydrogenase